MKVQRARFAALVLLSALVAAAVQEARPLLPRYDLENRTARFELPGRLEEISGLASTPGGRLFGHDDERATVHEIDRLTGVVGKRFSLGDPPIRDDFEGIAIVGARFFLITSLGLLYEFREVGDREASPYQLTDTGLGATCESEGLDYDEAQDVLLIACKTTAPERDNIVVHRLPLDPSRGRLAPIEIARNQLGAFGVGHDFQASSLAVSPAGTMFLVSAAPEALIEVDRTGRVLAGTRLRSGRHPQPEGLAFAPDSALLIADEQNGDPARITTYGTRVTGRPR